MQEMQETLIGPLDGEDPLEEETATHSSILAWKILWTEGPGGHSAYGVAKSCTRLSEQAHIHLLPKKYTYVLPKKSFKLLQEWC